jgi:uncharacterized protein involved in exopolysaccharide biosynthesis/Mrp family chromosome partitioning ATPase
MPSEEIDTSIDGAPPESGMGVDDVLYILFRQKWIILFFLCLGVVGAAAVRILRPPFYSSQAELNVPYVTDRGVGPNQGDSMVHSTDSGAQGIINTEVSILKSLDVASNVAWIVGPQRILAKRGGGSDIMSAAGMICSGIEADAPQHSSVLTINFRHPDPAIVQPVLSTLIEVYKQKHLEVHQGLLDDYYRNRRDDLKTQLENIQEKLKGLKKNAGVLFVDDSKHAYQTQIVRLQNELLDAQRELEERKAVMGAAGQAIVDKGTNVDLTLGPEQIEEYTTVLADLNAIKQTERVLMREFKSAYPLLQSARERKDRLTREKEALLAKYPSLTQMNATGSGTGTNGIGTGFAADVADIKRLVARVAKLDSQLNLLQTNAAKVLEIEPQIAELELQREMTSTNLLYYSTSIEHQRSSESLGAGKVINIKVFQSPTPPARDDSKMKKKLMTVFGGCVATGLVLAFLIEMFVDRSLRRRVDVERRLNIPVLLNIPALGRGTAALLNSPVKGEETALTIGGGNPALQEYAEGLRERVMTHFEVKNMGDKKPKLVGLTSCGAGAGVTTLAGGLAAALSKTGNGNVLLVTMNPEKGVAHSFYNGKPGCGLAQVLEPARRSEAQVQDNLYVANLEVEKRENKSKVSRNGVTSLMPKIQGSDYDYIIFDMPPVSETSSTPRMASHMDMMLLVLESEKTNHHKAKRANTLMQDSGATVTAVLNKYRKYVPERLAQEL